MKRKKKRLVEEFENLVQEVIPANYFFPYQRDTVNLWWFNGKEPVINTIHGDGQGCIIQDFSKIQLPILKMLVKELTKREKIKNKIDQGI